MKLTVHTRRFIPTRTFWGAAMHRLLINVTCKSEKNYMGVQPRVIDDRANEKKDISTKNTKDGGKEGRGAVWHTAAVVHISW